MTTRLGKDAIVIGASMSGLLAARAASPYFERVTVLERDDVVDRAESRKGQPQTRHLHALLAEGLRIFDDFFPTLRDQLVAGGAVLGDMGNDIRWHAFGGYRRQFESGMVGVMMSRPFLELCVRRCVEALPNVTIRGGVDVEAPTVSDDRRRVTGVQLKAKGDRPAESLSADLVIDTSGRGSATPRWLETWGYEKPTESAVTVNMGYATRTFRRSPNDLRGAKLILISPDFPSALRAGNVMPVEGDRWMVTLIGWSKDYPPTDEAGFLDYAKSLPAPDLHDLVSRVEPLSDGVQHRLPSNLRRHYEKIARFPERYAVLGDAVCSFNPVYAQGMTSAAMQAMALHDTLAGGLDRLHARQSSRAAKYVDRAWQLAVGEDFRSPETTGPKPPGLDMINAYVTHVHRATHRDVHVYRTFLDVMNLVRPGTSLMRPDLMLRTFIRGSS